MEAGSGGQGDPTFDTAQAIAVVLEKHGIACDLIHGFDWDKWTTGKPTERLALIPAGQEHILEQEDGKKRWVQVVTELSRALMNAPRAHPSGSACRGRAAFGELRCAPVLSDGAGFLQWPAVPWEIWMRTRGGLEGQGRGA